MEPGEHTILHKEQLSENVFLFRVRAPLIAKERKAGQFIILSVDEEYGERIPLTIADADVAEGSITLIFQRVGYSTLRLAEFQVGEAIPVLVGRWGGRRTSRRSARPCAWAAGSGWRRCTRSSRR